MLAGGDVLRELFRGQERSHGQAGGDRLGDADDVGLHAEMLERKQLSGASHAALDLVEDERRLMLGRQFAAGLQKFRCRLLNAAFALDGLQHDAADLVVHGGTQSFDIVARHEAHALQHGIEIFAVLGLAGERQRAHGAAVERIVERDDDRLLRPTDGVSGGAHHFQRAFDGLGAAVGEEGAVHARLRTQLLRQQALILVVVEIGDVDDLRRLVADHLHDAGMRVAKRVHAQPGQEVQIPLAVHVVHVDALAARDGHGITRIGVEKVLLLTLDDLLIRRHDDDLAKSLLYRAATLAKGRSR